MDPTLSYRKKGLQKVIRSANQFRGKKHTATQPPESPGRRTTGKSRHWQSMTECRGEDERPGLGPDCRQEDEMRVRRNQKMIHVGGRIGSGYADADLAQSFGVGGRPDQGQA